MHIFFFRKKLTPQLDRDKIAVIGKSRKFCLEVPHLWEEQALTKHQQLHGH
jgi:hypothetical protein